MSNKFGKSCRHIILIYVGILIELFIPCLCINSDNNDIKSVDITEINIKISNANIFLLSYINDTTQYNAIYNPNWIPTINNTAFNDGLISNTKNCSLQVSNDIY